MFDSRNNLNGDVIKRNIGDKNYNRKISQFLEIRTNCKIETNESLLCALYQPSNKLKLSRPFLDETEDSESFHRAIGPTLVVAQCFGILPICGVTSTSPEKLTFKIRTYRLMYSLIIIILTTFMTILSIVYMIQTLKAATHGRATTAVGAAVFYGNGLLCLVIFLRLSPQWITLQKHWRSMETFLGRCKKARPPLRRKFQLLTVGFLGFAVVEHVLCIMNGLSGIDFNGNLTWTDYLEIHTERSHGFILTSINYNTALGIFLFIINKYATFMWSFTDLFITLVSVGLAERYKYLNKIFLQSSQLNLATIDWGTYREYFATLSLLVKRTDNVISPIILLSFAFNLYGICVQLLNSISPESVRLLNIFYYVFSMAFLICRTLAVTLFAARINDQSKVALPILYNCPSSNYTIEVQRLQSQLENDDVYLTGLQFFSITRNFMLAAAGAIATYEIVLLQFNTSTGSK